MWLPNEQRVVYSHDVVFNELCFPWKDSQSSLKEPEEADYLSDFLSSPSELTTREDRDSGSDTSTPSPDPAEPLSVTPDCIVPSGIVKGDQESASETVLSADPAIDNSANPLSAAHPPRPLAIHDISSKIDTANILPTRSRRHATSATALQAPVTSNSDPVTYDQAISRSDSDHWIASMNKELASLEAMNVWEEVPLPPGQHALGTKWVYKKKTGPSGELLKYKARLCAQGFSQIEGLDHSETYAPTG